MYLPEIFQRLQSSRSRHAFIAEPLLSGDAVYLGVDPTGRPALFVVATEGPVGPSMRTSQVSLRPAERYVLTLPDGSQRRESFHAIMCDEVEGADVRTFLVLLEAFLSGREGTAIPGYSEFLEFFRSMIRLFALRPAPNLRETRQGLWGELFMMSRVRGFRFWAPSWHNPLTQLFDFTVPGKHVEVKTTMSSGRVHGFSHRQIFALGNEQIMVASLILTENETGLSLGDLISECRTALGGTYHYLKLEAATRRAGMETGAEKGPCFDIDLAQASLCWYRSTDLPQFRTPEPLGVSETSYRVDVSLATPLEQSELDT
ncbi:MAG TPA: PD-(D/E)XK motif protein, partial [Candidatus Bathyarchaeia archaeon]